MPRRADRAPPAERPMTRPRGRQRLPRRHRGDGRARVPRGAPDRERRATSASRAANNLAIRAAPRDYVLALNPDTRITAGRARPPARADGRPARGRHLRAAGSSWTTARFDHAARRSFPTPLSALGHFTGHRPPRASRARSPPTARPRSSGAGRRGQRRLHAHAPRARSTQVGLFDEGYWMYMEDLDLCYRFARGRLGHLVRAVGDGHPRQGRHERRHRSPRLNYAFHYGMLPLLPRRTTRRGATP